MGNRILVTGGSGYIGAAVVGELQNNGYRVRVLDALLHGQKYVMETQQSNDVEVIYGDVCDPDTLRSALEDVEGVVHLASIVGDPACARNPELAEKINIRATEQLIEELRNTNRRLIFASTCSNYGRTNDSSILVDETAALAPISLYAESKVVIEKQLLEDGDDVFFTCLRFATVYGVASRMRFDLTVNEFTRDLWADKELEIFGEYFWRPYVHVNDVARAVRVVLEAPKERVRGQVYNVGTTSENYRKIDLVEAIRQQIDTGKVTYVHRSEDPRDYKVNFDKINIALGYQPQFTVPDGIKQTITALQAKQFGDPFNKRYSNVY